MQGCVEVLSIRGRRSYFCANGGGGLLCKVKFVNWHPKYAHMNRGGAKYIQGATSLTRLAPGVVSDGRAQGHLPLCRDQCSSGGRYTVVLQMSELRAQNLKVTHDVKQNPEVLSLLFKHNSVHERVPDSVANYLNSRHHQSTNLEGPK